ncbi:hypothetical protein FHR32_006622 [Streptosporangium album]|uniref:Uncharacterized protein n=1 Tax=Streptosporangium album TaxID=47479 RepID=A0A7W7S3D7_9ACTN|nr:hypothetical protein [Streptosporangium album]
MEFGGIGAIAMPIRTPLLIKKCGRDTGLTTYQALFSQVTSLKDEVFRQKRGTVCGRAGPA